MANETEFQEGDWVKEKNGTRGMTVASYGDGDAGSRKITCRFKDENGEEVEKTFDESELAPL